MFNNYATSRTARCDHIMNWRLNISLKEIEKQVRELGFETKCQEYKLHGANKTEKHKTWKNSTWTKKHLRGIETSTWNAQRKSYQQNHRISFIGRLRLLCMYTDENTLVIGTLLCKKKRIQHGSPGHDESTVEASLGRVGGGEQCEARRAHNTPQGGLHREKRRLRFSTWSRNDIWRPDGKRRPTLYVRL